MLKPSVRAVARVAVTIALSSPLLMAAGGASAQQPSAPAPAAAANPSGAASLVWPRSFDLAGGNLLQVYQPLIEQWDGDQLSGRAAIAIGPKNGTPTYGIAHFTALVAIDKPAKLAQLSNIRVVKVDVPTAPSQDVALMSALQSRLPPQGITVALDHLTTSYAAAKELSAELAQPVQNTPPKIVFAASPTLLVLVAGKPVLQPLQGVPGYQRVINTRPLILVDANGVYHLQAAGSWYEATSLEGSWVVTASPSPALEAAGGTANYEEAADAMMPADGKKPAQPAAVIVATMPTEVIVTNGQPQMVPVDGTSLLRMSNADHAVLLDPSSNDYYVLISGRWFKARDLKGPWAFVPGSSLPGSFAKIAATDPVANVLVSVPGTPQAKEAAIAASVPQTATIARNTDLTIQYDGGAAKFVPISGTVLAYAENTRTPVIRLDAERYYAVFQGAWFVSSTPGGPWVVADVVPAAIYTIPVSSPLHYVTYVRVYASTADSVVVGYTPGYFGVVLAPGGTVVYGSGYDCVGYVGTYWYGCPVTYGYDAAFGWTDGFAFGFAPGWGWGYASPWWGPYWGPGPWGGTWNAVNVNQTNIYGQWGGNATVNHAYGYNSWTGNQWSQSNWSGQTGRGTAFSGRSGAAFNPWSGNYAAGAENSRYNPATGASGASRSGITGNVDTGNFAAGRQSAGYDPATGTGHASETGITRDDGNVSVASRGVAGNVNTGNAVGWNNGNIYTDHDGTIHQYSNDGWQHQTIDGWDRDTDPDQINRLDTQRQFQDMGGQRFDDFARGGGYDGFGGGDRFGGGDFGGDRFGGGGGFGGGFRGGFGGGFGGGFRR
ncbi:carbohydrate-binding protein [Bosea sp. 117]|uniref:carbohydrate-binding protein n=1 Tax=Bosea sp. 117 TaxID=1125973 RepID=UPI000493EDFE|nr:carbohydrate-binding protein [Bosea sp. 117]